MKKIIIILSLLSSIGMFSQTTTPKLFINLNSHNEMTTTEAYDTGPAYTYYNRTRDTLKKIVDLIYSKNARYDLQTCQKFVLGSIHAEAAATSTTDILEYAYKIGGPPYGRIIEIDPRYKTQSPTYTYNIADVAHLIDSTGAQAGKIVGGFLSVDATIPTSLNWTGDWTPFTTTITGVFNKPWKADIIWGAGSSPPHVHDANNYGNWKPRSNADSLSFYCHDPSQNVWIQGNGCGWDISATTNIQTMISEIRSEATKIVNGTYPSNKFYNASIMFNFKDFQTLNLRPLLSELIDSLNVMAAQNKIVWATITQKQDSFNVWSLANSIPYSQWKCGQTGTVAATCNLSSVKEFKADNAFLKVYPNPAGSELTYELQSLTGKETYFYVYDNLGRVAIKAPVNESIGKISLDNLPSGLYLIKVEGMRPKKLLIVK
jgi:hypothetical protein